MSHICKVFLVNPLTFGNTWQYNQLFVSIVAADGLMLKHQDISTHYTDSVPIALQFSQEMVTLALNIENYLTKNGQAI